MKEASRIEKELKGKKKSLGEKDAAPYLRRISKLFYHASREVETRGQQKEAAQSLYSVLSEVAENVRPSEERLSNC
ncbi:hypothetical protein HZC09_00470 [Candidatus Micrarchaeota archaeon]|nr:hypothetical protein [Candidatus Micrarchaeota archaeon]